MSTKPKRRTRRWILISLLVIAAIVAGFVFTRNREAPPQRTAVERITLGTFTRTISGTGLIEAAQSRNLSFKNSGKVASIAVKEGDRVEAGTVLATLDSASLQRDLASARSNLQSAQADLARIRAQQQVDQLDINSSIASADDALQTAQEALQKARLDLSTTQQLFDKGAASRNELQAAQDAYAQAERRVNQSSIALQTARARNNSFSELSASQIASSEAQIATLQTTIANLEEQLSEAQLIAPYAGIVTAINFDVGDTISPADTLELIDDSSLTISASFDENRSTELRVDQPVIVTPDANTQLELAARVTRVSPVADRNAGSAAQVEAEMVFTDDSEQVSLIKPGYTVTTKVLVNQIDDVMVIPLEAVSESATETWVFKIAPSEEDTEGEGIAVRTPVTILDRNATVAAITSDGLNAGDLIAVINLDVITDGTLVAFDPPAETTE